MSIRATGRVVGGHLRVDIAVDLPDNTEVELIEATGVAETSEEEELDPELEAALDEGDAALARGERGEPVEEVLEQLRARRAARDDAAVSGTAPPQG
jgi:hypothetical protein